jgi:hypothetical protein
MVLTGPGFDGLGGVGLPCGPPFTGLGGGGDGAGDGFGPGVGLLGGICPPPAGGVAVCGEVGLGCADGLGGEGFTGVGLPPPPPPPPPLGVTFPPVPPPPPPLGAEGLLDVDGLVDGDAEAAAFRARISSRFLHAAHSWVGWTG